MVKKLSIYAISDLHLSLKNNKPMDIFGNEWKNHDEKKKKDWKEKVKENDLVLLPGDFSWATYLEDTYPDFEYLNNLPGKKILLKGNHDYWWSTITSMRKYLEENSFKNIDFLYNNSYCFEEHIIVGTRGWSALEEGDTEKMIKRECARLELSFLDSIKKYGKDKPIIVCMHYPPMKEFLAIMKKYNAKICLYGHLHGKQQLEVKEGIVNGVNLLMVSSDYLQFKLKKIV